MRVGKERRTKNDTKGRITKGQEKARGEREREEGKGRTILMGKTHLIHTKCCTYQISDKTAVA